MARYLLSYRRRYWRDFYKKGHAMKRYKPTAFVFLFCLLALSLTLFSTPSHGSRSDVEAFVTRFYQQCLDRAPDSPGLNNWANTLMDGTGSGADVAYGFIFSTEFLNKNTSNEDYLYVLYRAFFNREPDTGGLNNWLGVLNQDAVGDRETRESVLDGFLYSQEFSNLCAVYGISATSDSGGGGIRKRR